MAQVCEHEICEPCESLRDDIYDMALGVRISDEWQNSRNIGKGNKD